MATTIRSRFTNLPDSVDLEAFLGTKISLDDSLAAIDYRQEQVLASLDRLFEYQSRLETYVRILQAQQQHQGAVFAEGTR